MRAGQDRDADDVDVLLHGSVDDLLGRAMQAGVDDVHAGVAQRARDDLDAAVVAVEADLGDDHADAVDGVQASSDSSVRGCYCIQYSITAGGCSSLAAATTRLAERV